MQIQYERATTWTAFKIQEDLVTNCRNDLRFSPRPSPKDHVVETDLSGAHQGDHSIPSEAKIQEEHQVRSDHSYCAFGPTLLPCLLTFTCRCTTHAHSRNQRANSFCLHKWGNVSDTPHSRAFRLWVWLFTTWDSTMVITLLWLVVHTCELDTCPGHLSGMDTHPRKVKDTYPKTHLCRRMTHLCQRKGMGDEEWVGGKRKTPHGAWKHYHLIMSCQLLTCWFTWNSCEPKTTCAKWLWKTWQQFCFKNKQNLSQHSRGVRATSFHRQTLS